MKLAGAVDAQQTALIIESVADVVEKSQPEPNNYWWLLAIAVIPAVIAAVFARKKK